MAEGGRGASHQKKAAEGALAVAVPAWPPSLWPVAVPLALCRIQGTQEDNKALDPAYPGVSQEIESVDKRGE